MEQEANIVVPYSTNNNSDNKNKSKNSKHHHSNTSDSASNENNTIVNWNVYGSNILPPATGASMQERLTEMQQNLQKLKALLLH